MNAADGQLIEALREALATTPAEPSVDEIDTLHQLVATRGAVATVLRLQQQPSRPTIRTKRTMTVAAACAALLVGVAVLASDTMPRPVASLAHRIGLPVEAPEVHDARMALIALRTALNTHDRTRTVRARDAVVAAMASLGRNDRSALEGNADTLLREADTALNVQLPPTGVGSPPAATAPPNTGGNDVGSPQSAPTPSVPEETTEPQDGSQPPSDATTSDQSAPSTTVPSNAD